MAFIRKITTELRHTSNGERSKIIIVLEDIRSMHNVGAAFRTADALGASALWLVGYTPAPPHRDIHKTALGAEETVPWQKFQTTGDALNAATGAGCRIVAVEQAHGAVSLNSYARAGSDLAIFLGNEVTGVSDAVLEAAQDCIEIPQQGAKHSLNVSVALGIVLWQLSRNG